MKYKFEKIYKFIFHFSYIIIALDIFKENRYYYISIKNSLCFSWIPFNKYEIRNRLCNINCSYVRNKLFPLNTPLNCKKVNPIHYKSKNMTFKIYLFNTSTYGVNINKYRFFYQNSFVL